MTSVIVPALIAMPLVGYAVDLLVFGRLRRLERKSHTST